MLANPVNYIERRDSRWRTFIDPSTLEKALKLVDSGIPLTKSIASCAPARMGIAVQRSNEPFNKILRIWSDVHGLSRGECRNSGVNDIVGHGWPPMYQLMRRRTTAVVPRKWLRQH
jgi:hypothetical protein